MANPKDQLDAYLQTVERMEKDITFVDASAFYASASISLRRIADALETKQPKVIEFYNYQDGKTYEFVQMNETDSRNVYRNSKLGEIIYAESKR